MLSGQIPRPKNLAKKKLSPQRHHARALDLHFDGAFSCRNGGAGIVLTSPKGDKLYYAVQLCFAIDKISNNIAEFEGLLAGLRAAITLGIQRLLIKGDS